MRAMIQRNTVLTETILLHFVLIGEGSSDSEATPLAFFMQLQTLLSILFCSVLMHLKVYTY